MIFGRAKALIFKRKKKNTPEIDKSLLPKHVAIIMDGNGRWAKKRGVPKIVGHRAGAEALRRVSRFAGRMGIEYITVYAFSTENWKRSEQEVSDLMSLLMQYLKNAEKELAGDEVRIRVIGDKTRFFSELQKEMDRVENVTAKNKACTVNIALNYGSRDEITLAVRKISAMVRDGKMKCEDICEKTISENLYTYYMPDPDLVIRSSGEQRLSNFLMWQSSYSELYFTDTLWPDFDENEFMKAIEAYVKRDRRFGGR